MAAEDGISNLWQVGPMIQMALSNLIGGVITLVVSLYFYRRAAQELRWEARAGNFSQEVMELLVALYEWGGNLKPHMAIALGSGTAPETGAYHFPHVAKLLTQAGLGYASSVHKITINRKGDGTLSEDLNEYTAIILTDEARSLAKYLLRARRFARRVVHVYRSTPDDAGLRELIWSADISQQLGPLGPYRR